MKLKKITKQAVQEAHERESKRICFSVYEDHLPKKISGGKYYAKINLPFGEGISKVFPVTLFPNQKKPGHVWHSIKNEDVYNKILTWCIERKEYVYLRDCLSISAALNFNKPNNITPDYTEVGQLVADSKETYNNNAVACLVELSLNFININDPYKEVDYICAVPPTPHKEYDLPSTIAIGISNKLQLKNITSDFIFEGQKQSVKEILETDPDFLEKKWSSWDNSKITYKGETLKNMKIMLIDDNYQSGTSMQYIAMILQNHGADEIYGLCMTKTLRDKGN